MQSGLNEIKIEFKGIRKKRLATAAKEIQHVQNQSP